MKIAVLGAGSMGSLLGGFLSQKHEVHLVDIWRDHVDAINEKGLRVRINGEVHTFHPKATTDPEQAKDSDLVIVFVKSTQTADALAQNKALLGEKTIVLCQRI